MKPVLGRYGKTVQRIETTLIAVGEEWCTVELSDGERRTAKTEHVKLLKGGQVMKKKCLVAVCCIVAFLVGVALGKEQKHLPGGSDWKNLSSADHALYLGGFLQGYTEGVLHAGTLAMARFAPEKVSSLTTAEKTDYQQTLPLAQKVNSALTHKITGQDLESALSAFYGDYRNIPVCWDDAVILSATSLVGNVATDPELNAARKSGATRGCR